MIILLSIIFLICIGVILFFILGNVIGVQKSSNENQEEVQIIEEEIGGDNLITLDKVGIPAPSDRLGRRFYKRDMGEILNGNDKINNNKVGDEDVDNSEEIIDVQISKPMPIKPILKAGEKDEPTKLMTKKYGKKIRNDDEVQTIQPVKPSEPIKPEPIVEAAEPTMQPGEPIMIKETNMEISEDIEKNVDEIKEISEKQRQRMQLRQEIIKKREDRINQMRLKGQ